MKKGLVTEVSHDVCIYSQPCIQWYCVSSLKLAMMGVFTLYTWRNTTNQIFFPFFLGLTIKHSHYWLQVVTWDYIFLFDRQIPPLYGSVSLSKPLPPYPLDPFCLCRLRLDYSLLWAPLQSLPPPMIQATITFCLVFLHTLVIGFHVSTLVLLAFFQSSLHTAAGVIFTNCKTFTQAGEINKIKGEIIEFKI